MQDQSFPSGAKPSEPASAGTGKTIKPSSKKPASSSVKGISRIDAKGTHGWYVRIKKNGKSYAKLFSDSKYNGREHALKCAKKAHALALETMQTAAATPSRRLVTTDKRNKTGMIGVNKTFKTNSKGEVTEYYQVTWSPAPGKIKNRQWSVRKYGRDEAFRLAKSFREEIMISIYGERYTRQVLISPQTPDPESGSAPPVPKTDMPAENNS